MQDSSRRGIPVKASEAFATIVAALAAEQIIQGALTSFHRLSWDYPLEKVALLLMMLGSIFTAVRFYHGNAVYLASTYPDWHHAHVPSRAKLSLPLTHAVDVFAHLLEYAVLVGVGLSLASVVPTSIPVGSPAPQLDLAAAYWWHAVLLVLDVLWVTAAQNLRGDDLDREARTAQLRWAKINAVLVALCLLSLAAPRIAGWFSLPPPTAGVAVAFSLVLILAAFADYFASYEFYFSSKLPHSLVPTRQAEKALTLVGEALLAEVSAPASADQLIDFVESQFAYFMHNKKNREGMFERSSALLNIGVYVNEDRHLRPVLRIYDKGIVPTNINYFIGSSYVGSAFTTLLESPDAAGVNFDSPDEDHDATFRRTHAQQGPLYYQSGIHAPLRTRSGELFGTLVVTSSKAGYFTGHLHLLMFSLLARRLARVIETVSAGQSPKDYLLKAFPTPKMKELP